jgi:hypothetical protein
MEKIRRGLEIYAAIQNFTLGRDESVTLAQILTNVELLKK